MSPWCATVFCQAFGECAALEVGLVLRKGIHALHQKDIDWINANLNHRRNPTNSTLAIMKSLFSSFILLAAGLLVLERALILAETFTEGVRVSPEMVTLKPGEYVWEPERAPEGPLLIVASITEQVAYVYRNGIRIARSSCSTGRPGHRTPTGVFTILEK